MTNKRLLSLLLILVMLFTISACKGGGNTDDPSASGETTPTPNEMVDILSTTTPEPNKMKPVIADRTDNSNAELVYEDIFLQDFDEISSAKEAGWSTFISGKVDISKDGGVDDTPCIKYYDATRENNRYQFSSPSIDLFKHIKNAGSYKISFMTRLGGEDVDSVGGTGFDITIRGGANDVNSFISQSKTNYLYTPTSIIDGEIGDWMTVEFDLTVLASDLQGTHKWNLCMHKIDEYVTEIYIDNFKIQYAEPAPETEKLVTNAETWVANEMTFIANKTVDDPVNTQTLDVEFTNGNQTITMPGFWDGGNVWRVRFALTAEGTWTYKTIFSDTSDGGVHNKTGSIEVAKYSGDLDIYKHGFVTTKENTKYFVYADGTPFFYLGDTHWTMLAEEYTIAGSKAAGIDTSSHFKYIVNKRVQQGYTVYQSQPNGAAFDLTNGIGPQDISGFQIADKYFKYIADQGLVHANSQFFFASTMNRTIMEDYTQAEYEKLLDTLSRYWVARFGAYPVMWTLAQEVDNDFYYMRDATNTTMNATNNPWKYVCEALYKYDPYKNPISAHQEGASTIINNTTATNSAFRNTEGHTWWATQWKPALNEATDFSAAVDYWANGQGKPAVTYEGRYESLWTNEYGARAQGWLSFLNGVFGYGYGAIDIWYYNSSYDMDKNTTRDGVTITVETKQTPWGKAIEYAAGYQMGYMRDFFEKYEWWKLTPAFSDKKIFTSETGTYSVAYIGTDLYIAYLFDDISKEGTLLTGTFKSLDADAEYTYQWFNPRTTAMSAPEKVNKSGTEFAVGERPSQEDWVLVVQKVK